MNPYQYRTHATKIIAWVIVVAVAWPAIVQGNHLRAWLYQTTGKNDLRFKGDIRAAWRQGTDVLQLAQREAKSKKVTFREDLHAYFVRYDWSVFEHPDGDYDVDYPPARLLVMTWWVWDITTHTTGRMGLPENVDAALLRINTGFVLAAAIAAFLLVRSILIRQRNRPNEIVTNIVALCAALLVWFNAAVLIDAHVWPQWEAWVLPVYFLAAWLGLMRKWLLVGIVLGVGAMFKGQILITATVFILWPIFQMRWRGALEVAAGLLGGVMICAAPWMFRQKGAAICFTILAAVFCTILRWIPRGWKILYIFAWLGPLILLCGYEFGGSFAWYYVGFEFGTRHHLSMIMGPANNLANILDRNGWALDSAPVHLLIPRLHIDSDISMRIFLGWIYVIMLVISAAGLAIQDSRRDRRVLMAIALPWLAMFAFMPQMHDRYLVWGAGISAIAIGVSAGCGFLHLVVTALACLPMVYNLIGYNNDQRLYRSWWEFVGNACEQTPILTVMVTLMFAYMAVSPRIRSSRGTNAI